jgi:uncharacterized protein DUF6461
VTGLTWLYDHPDVGSWPFCLTFVRGVDAHSVLRRFGAEPGDAFDARATIPFGAVQDPPVVMVRRSGEWTVALEENIPAQGTRPEVLRRVSADTETVAIYNDIGKGNNEFAHALNGEIVTAVTTSIPPHWRGSEPGRLRSLAEEIAQVDDDDSGPLDLEVLLALAEGVFGVSLDPADLDHRSWLAAPMLPVLDDLPAPRLDQTTPRVGDPVLDLMLAYVPETSLTRILAVRCDRVLAEVGFDDHPVLVNAIRDALAGQEQHAMDDTPLGLALRAVALKDPNAAAMLRRVLAGRHLDAFPSDVFLHRVASKPGWRDQFIADLGDLDVPAGELRAAEEARCEQERRLRPRARFQDRA